MIVGTDRFQASIVVRHARGLLGIVFRLEAVLPSEEKLAVYPTVQDVRLRDGYE